MKEDVLIIGSGPASLMTAIIASKNRKITILEKDSKNFKLGKRILVSGNGRANFFNLSLLENKELENIYSYQNINYGKEFLKFLNDNGFYFVNEDNLLYPLFNRAESLHSFLLDLLNKKNVKIIKGEAIEVKDNSLIYIDSDNKTNSISFNDLVIATGGRSYDRDDFKYNLLNSLNVKYKEFSPCLCPIVVKEKIPAYLADNRLKGKLSLYSGNKKVYEEVGEILFKKDGLSGICVFNSTLVINNLIRDGKDDIKIHFDYLYNLNQTEIDNLSLSSLPSFLSKYLKDNKLRLDQELIFTFKELYPFKFSQISYGGILLSELDLNDFSLNNNKNIHAIGEILDLNFICGGYNMGMAFIEGYKLGDRLSERR